MKYETLDLEDYDCWTTYCPSCGNPLRLVKTTAKSVNDKSNWWVCNDGCFSGTHLIEHQPFNGINSAPGDSWSLSWVK